MHFGTLLHSQRTQPKISADNRARGGKTPLTPLTTEKGKVTLAANQSSFALPYQLKNQPSKVAGRTTA